MATAAAVLEGLDAIEADAEQTFHDTIVRIVDGAAVDAAEIRAAMLAANLTREELQRQIETARLLKLAAEALGERVPALKADAAAKGEAFESLAATVRKEVAAHELRIRTLGDELDRAKIHYDDARHALMAAETDSKHFLNRHLSVDVRRRIESTGSASVVSGNRLHALRSANEYGARDKKIAEAETAVAERQRECDRLAALDSPSPNAVDGAARELADAQAALDSLLAERAEQEQLTTSLAAARDEHERLIAEAMTDWRSMRFDVA